MFTSFLQHLPNFKGKFRLLRIFLGSYLRKAKDIEIHGRNNIVYKVPNISECIGFELFVNGVYEKDYIDLIVQSIPANGVLLDLGANIGSISIPIAKQRPDIKIFAVEASPRVFSYLKYNVERNNCKNIYLENKALSTMDNETVSFYSPVELFGKGSLNPVFTNVGEHVSTLTIDTLVQDNNLEKVDFIKVDVEGFEKTVLSGGALLLSKVNPLHILFEFSDWMEGQAGSNKSGDCQKFLQDLGFLLYDVTEPKKPVLMAKIAKEGSFMILAKKGT